MHIRLINTDKPTGVVGFLPAGSEDELSGGGGEGKNISQNPGSEELQQNLAGEVPAVADPVQEGIFSTMEALHSIKKGPPSQEDIRLIAIVEDKNKPIQERISAAKDIKSYDALNENLAKLILEVLSSTTGQNLNNIISAIYLARKILDKSKRNENCQQIAQLFVLDLNDQIDGYIEQFIELFELIADKMDTDGKRHLIHDILRNNEDHKEFCDAIKQFVQSANESLLDTGKTDSKSARNT